jgi:hypothetical protein
LLRSTLAAARHGRIAQAEQTGGTPAPAPRRTPDAPRAPTPGPSRRPSAPSPCDASISPARPAIRASSPPTASSASMATSPGGPAA